MAAIVFTRAPGAWLAILGRARLRVERCARGWWMARAADPEPDDERRAIGLTRAEAVRRHRAGEYDGPCPGCTCGASGSARPCQPGEGRFSPTPRSWETP